MARKLVEAEVPDGARLGLAQDAEGGLRGLLFDEDTGKLIGHANLFEYDDSDDDSDDAPPRRDQEVDVVVEVIAQVLTNLVIYSVEKAAPHVQNWWNDKAVPTLKEKAVPAIKAAPRKVISAVKRTNRRAGSDDTDLTDVLAVNEAKPSVRVSEPPHNVEMPGPVMSSAEAQQRLARAVAAVAFAREQMRDLQNATIIEDDDQAFAGLLNEITPQHLEKAIRMALETNPLMLDSPNVPALTVSLGSGPTQGDLVPARPQELLPVARRDVEPTA